MSRPQPRTMRVLVVTLVAAVAAVAIPTVSWTEDRPEFSAKNRSPNRSQKTSATDKTIAEQLRELRAKVAKLETALQKKHMGQKHALHGSPGQSGSSPHGKTVGQATVSGEKLAGMKGKMAMGKQMMSGGMMKNGRGMMGSGRGMMGSGRGMMKNGRGMMGRMKGMARMTMPSALPGLPGASHIYHIGATGFLLDHPQHITLSLDQKTSLNKIKEEALLKQGTLDRRIEDAEQELWVLTSADKPNAAKIDAKIREIAKLGGDKRIAFIRAVGEAAQKLTDEQRKRLVGTLPDDHKAAAKTRQK